MADESYLLVFVRVSRMGCRPIKGPVSPQDKLRRNAYIYPCLQQVSKTQSREVANVPVRAWHRALLLQVLWCLSCSFRDHFLLSKCFMLFSFLIHCLLQSVFKPPRVESSYALFVFVFDLLVAHKSSRVHFYILVSQKILLHASII